MEQVVLLNDSGQAIGVTDKATVHHLDTPLHLAFSCYVFNGRGQLLLTQRAHEKRTWPGVWTNTCCGHPAPQEAMPEAITRRLGEELGLTVRDLTLVLPRFRYRAVMGNGVVENEICPVFAAFTDDEPAPNREEVAGTAWADWSGFSAEVLAGTTDISPWCRQQVAELVELGANPAEWPAADPADLPDAAVIAAG
ncbi:isopentenyl-diphosphate delta-isomerase [Saccharopolyspora erythraea NRRL 2338]|uniref:Isopentenyl-diphosphate Delta-isomerase n=2 Tax=Saccharopolyspora erythraea TaxID=1836 RepID=IDI_SACEN|nr:isopentenyl-diphosphate Delta-isomerase [Saccharopolyspora erythraea]A4FK76.1 RecName: Full=Isopentenyl-diphosphate Delta-isomerase; Short=IPP isomerase; AltName: Full=IPP:DMAPP isomerase; AltName: Full=Isopentenyl pyrophosphate isomerase [Saccharopolyspora erythraea NRRL 2338]EQD85265.1 isopentenyl-diphosphate delta-isomerase [Saccharopolyspora erythraea D]PFG98089.1 isopentenyl-diphosphate delta-isomerase [Saccharopolyspora erythraea NRRL 2338]QRK88199.1 isopentenyl-diphosphate Delta-isome